MDTLPHYALQGNLRFYVYVYKYPNGDIFYVGKGQGSRYYTHLDRVRRGIRDCNVDKQRVISELLSQGLEPTIEIAARFDNEQDALIYEWALIHFTIYSNLLTNKTTTPYIHQPKKRNSKEKSKNQIVIRRAYHAKPKQNKQVTGLPILDSPICIRSLYSKVETYHQITNIQSFMAISGVRTNTIKKLLEKGYTSDWEIMQYCPCQFS
jgi:hypothetical protein